MSAGGDDREQLVQERRELLLRDLHRLCARFRSNLPPDFAEIRNTYAIVAEMLFCGRDLRFTNLRGADLRNIDFRGSDLSGCDFSDARVRGAQFELTKMSRDSLTRARDWPEYRDSWEPEVSRKEARPAFFCRCPGERFSFSPQLPEIAIVGSEMLPWPGPISAEERRHVEQGRLAIAIRGLTNREIVHIEAPERTAESDDHRSPRPAYTAHSYCSGLTSLAEDFGLPPGTRATLPSYALFHALAATPATRRQVSNEADVTDLQATDLQLGTDGPEFVLSFARDGAVETAAARVAGKFSQPAFLPPGQHRRAIVRPIFFLGGN